ncbi:hypothetical protein Afil01_54770 [Actinorhabdospora filicis]|uniref:Uncharacterized protein n=1 Tax=Actinorhabdospora filicis TaxID=1785913 RepID=A0A9W6SRK5_9ACTN|nr:hypothetical protein [Actinorhabdospora filicis]GLZ80670.1 hypothetical protein Afil01_54770 [Actinorhabdospora filicis]
MKLRDFVLLLVFGPLGLLWASGAIIYGRRLKTQRTNPPAPDNPDQPTHPEFPEGLT